MNKNHGFTVIELIVVIAVLLGAGILFFYQSNTIQASARDTQRKTDINTLYHNLTKVYYPEHKSYPKDLTEKALPAVPPDTFKDPNGVRINATGSDQNLGALLGQASYRYQPTGCNQQTGACKGFSLTATLEREAQYTKTAPTQ